MSRNMVECMNCNALGRFDNGAVCPACDGAGEIEDDYTPTQLDKVEAKLDALIDIVMAMSDTPLALSCLGSRAYQRRVIHQIRTGLREMPE